jgi:hypothetical protein
MKWRNFNSALPDSLLQQLDEKSKSLSIPKSKLIERDLRVYLQHLERAEYIKSYKKAAGDKNVMLIAEEGMADYLAHLE